MTNTLIQSSSGAFAIQKDPKTGSICKMPAEEYRQKSGLSNSGMKDMAVSPYRYWHLHINPERPVIEESPEQKFGTGVHCLLLEGEAAFRENYARMLDEADYPDCLVTVEDLRAWLRDKGCPPKGTRKAELIEQVQTKDPGVAIWDVLEEAWARENHRKMACLPEDWARVYRAAGALRAEPEIEKILARGEAEVSMFGVHPDTGAPLKAKADWIGDCILDVKTFTQKRGKSIDQSVADAIYYEGYYRQAYLYAKLHQWITGAKKPTRFIFAFVESVEPHEVRIKEVRPADYGAANLYWQRAEIETRHLCQVWQEYRSEFGNRPWRRDQKVDPLVDEDMRSLAY